MLNDEIRWAAARVLLDPARLRVLLRGGLENALALRTFFGVIVPRAQRSLARLERYAARIPDDALREKALHTLSAKAYHVAGACVLATFLPSGAREHYIDIVAPLESIYDFLDTLCDRAPHPDEKASRRLHLALADALNPGAPMHEYYLYGPAGDDGDYLAMLVRRVRTPLQRLANYELLVPRFAQAAALYAETQILKQRPPGIREKAMDESFGAAARGAGVRWYEYAAAAGSQFHVYGALYAGFCSRFDLLDETYAAYFPEMCAVHVILDAFIDQSEDAAEGELNWTGCYGGHDDLAVRLMLLSQRAARKFDGLPLPAAHHFALRLMALFYLTHPKVARQNLDGHAALLLRALVPETT